MARSFGKAQHATSVAGIHAATIGGNALSNIFNPWQYNQVNGRGG